MKYFIDFEAMQFSNEIISVGCVSENGEKFYSLVQPKKAEKITEFITSLTGITYEELFSAPSADKVFSEFYEWVDKTEKLEFFCYGDCDDGFIKSTLKHNITDFYGQCGLSLIKSNLKDYSASVREHFGINRSIALKKVVEYYRGETIIQNHNSLEDAIYLKEIYENSINEFVKECPFPEYISENDKPKIKKLITAERGNVKLEFVSYSKAADWVMADQLSLGDIINDKTKSKICNRIKKAAEKSIPYFGYSWFVDNKSLHKSAYTLYIGRKKSEPISNRSKVRIIFAWCG